MYKKIIDARIFPQLIISKNNFTSSMHVEYGAKSKLIPPPFIPLPTVCSFPGGKSFSTVQRVAQIAHQSSLVPLVGCVACQESTGALLF